MSRRLITDRRLLIELGIMLTLKLLLLFVIWYQFFSTPPQLDNAQATAERLLPNASQEKNLD
jgi:hypothetical protein